MNVSSYLLQNWNNVFVYQIWFGTGRQKRIWVRINYYSRAKRHMILNMPIIYVNEKNLSSEAHESLFTQGFNIAEVLLNNVSTSIIWT